MRPVPHGIRPAILACALGLASALVAAPPASAMSGPLALDCQAKPPIGGTRQLLLDIAVDARAPAAVAPGATFDIVLAAGAFTLPKTAGRFSITNVRNLKVKVAIPAGAAFRAAVISGGSHLGGGVPSVALAGGVATLTVPGPVPGGARFQLPAVTLSLTATGAAGSAITTTLADPGLTVTANVRAVFVNLTVPVTCVGNANPVLTTTAIADPAHAPSPA